MIPRWILAILSLAVPAMGAAGSVFFDRDIHAAMPHLCGIDASAFTGKFQGLDFRLGGVAPARVIKQILA
jgi:hypothetical protein